MDGLSTKNLEHVDVRGFAEFLRVHDGDLAGITAADPLAMTMDKYHHPMYIGLSAPHPCDFSYVVHDGPYFDLYRHTGRIGRIMQLGVAKTGREYCQASHSRYFHSLVAAIMAERVLTKNGFEENAVNLGVAAGLLHDIAVPPFSDYGALGSGGLMDEEVNIGRLGSAELVRDLKKHGVDWNAVVACVRGGNPPVGQLINSRNGLDVDSLAYTATDVQKFYMGCADGRIGRHLSRPHLFDIHEDIVFRDGVFAFTDADKVYDFLMTRALMFRDVYYTPKNRAREAVLESELAKLWDDGTLSVKRLLAMDDLDFEKLLRSRLTENTYETIFGCDIESVKELGRFDRRCLAAVRDGFRKTSAMVYYKPTFNPKTETPVMARGRSKPFRLVLPRMAKNVENIARDCDYVGAYGPDKVDELISRI